MRLLRLSLADFRNLASVDIEPSARSTVFVGENGQGKTNLLESVYFLTALRPLRQARLLELIRLGTDRARVSGDFLGPGGSREVAVEIDPHGRTPYLDKKPQARLDSYFEGLAAVAFTPDDLLLVKAGPDGRRRFLDRAAFNRWPAVLGEAREYVRALRARNATLRELGPEADAVELSFRGPLVRAGARLWLRRRDLVDEIAPRVAEAFLRISGEGAPRADLAYRAAQNLSLLGDEQALSARLEEALAARLPRDRQRGFTSVGPHADDLALLIDGQSARGFGSQGQQRALVLAMKIAEIENLRLSLGRPPLLLLDDVSSELDPAKNRFLLEYLRALPGQAFLTTTDRRLLEPAAGPDSAFYEVVSGTVKPLV